jgi:predicted transcriptional regulator
MPIRLERFMKALDQLKRDTETGVVKMQDYDARLARMITELRESGLDADRAEATAALAAALHHGVITAPVEAHLQQRLGLG